MIVVDTSAIVAIALGEPERQPRSHQTMCGFTGA
jgi:uncharacterized protein with PIN domain